MLLIVTTSICFRLNGNWEYCQVDPWIDLFCAHIGNQICAYWSSRFPSEWCWSTHVHHFHRHWKAVLQGRQWWETSCEKAENIKNYDVLTWEEFGENETQVGMEQHLEEAEVEITIWPMSLESQFSSTRLREADITGSVEHCCFNIDVHRYKSVSW